MVAGLPPECIVVLRRVEDKVECRHLSAYGEHLDVRGMRADQILTSPLFGLEATRDPKIQAKLQRYNDLASRQNFTSVEQEEFDGLVNDPDLHLSRAPSAEEREEARVAAGLIREYFDAQIVKMDPTLQRRLMDEIQAQMLEAKSGVFRRR